MSRPVTPQEARAALDTIERGRLRIVEEIDLPTWYWWGLALGWVCLGLLNDLTAAWIASVATFVFGAVHASVASRVLDGRHRSRSLTVRADLAGRRVARIVIAGLVALVVVTIAVAVAVQADGARHPVTIASAFVAVIILLGGPRLLAATRARVEAAAS